MENYGLNIDDKPEVQLSDPEVKILSFIPYGEENAMSRESIVLLSKYSDREVRRCISSLRKKTAIIHRKRGGYFRPLQSDIESVARYISQEKSRAKCIYENIRYAEKYLEDMKRGIV